MNITLEIHNGITVLRDDKLIGGTKSVIVDRLVGNDFVYASPVYGGFQIALAETFNERAHIFCAKRKILHYNTEVVLKRGANVHQVEHGYLSVVEKAAREFAKAKGYTKIAFGAAEHKELLVKRVKQVIARLGQEPEEIWVAIGSGTLFEAILEGTKFATVCGVAVGKVYENFHVRANIYYYPLPFHKECTYPVPFPSMANYDRKAWEFCNKLRLCGNTDILFWNVL